MTLLKWNFALSLSRVVFVLMSGNGDQVPAGRFIGPVSLSSKVLYVRACQAKKLVRQLL
jgi:hypothetical protein